MNTVTADQLTSPEAVLEAYERLLRITYELGARRTRLASRGWTVGFDRAQKRFGCCFYDRRHLSVSLPLVERNLDTPEGREQILDTLKHEVAHALAVMVFGRKLGGGHGRYWKMACRVTGASPQRCYSGRGLEKPKPKYVAICPKCMNASGLYKRTKLERSCGKCYPRTYNPAYRLDVVTYAQAERIFASAGAELVGFS